MKTLVADYEAWRANLVVMRGQEWIQDHGYEDSEDGSDKDSVLSDPSGRRPRRAGV